MRRIAALLCLSLAASSAFAQGSTVSDDVTFTRGPDPWGASLQAGLVGVSQDGQISQLSRTGWAFRIEGDLDDQHETLLPTPDTQAYAGAESQIRWIDVAGRGLLAAVERTTVVDVDGPGGSAPGGRVEMSLEVTNIRPVPLTFSLFHVIDPDLAGTPGDDAASLLLGLSEPTIRFQDKEGTFANYSGNDVDAYAVRAKGDDDVVAILADGDFDNPGDDGLPATAMDATAMFAWQNRTLAPGQSLTVRVRFAVNSPLQSDLALAMTGSPSPVARGAVLEYSAMVSNVSNAQHPSPASRLTFDLDATDVTIIGTKGCDNDPMGYPVCELGLIEGGQSREVALKVSPGIGTEPEISMTGTAGSPLTQDIVPQDNTVQVETEVLPHMADLLLGKTNDRNGVASDIDGWTWTLTLRNAAAASAPATFAQGQRLLLDQMPGNGMMYAVSHKLDANVTGTIQCNVVADDLACTASSPVSMPPGSVVEVSVYALPPAPGMYSNPRLGGVCLADPQAAVAESNETNNTCADSVLAVDFMLFSDGFEE